MRTIVSLLVAGPFALWLVAAPAAAQVDAYTLDADIDPVGARISAEATLTFTADSASRAVEYWLNQGLELEDVDATVPVAGVRRDTLRRGGYRWAAQAEPVTITFERSLRPGEEVSVTLRYRGRIVPDRWQANILTEDWFELGLYSGWYPLVPGDLSFTYDARVLVPADYRVTGLGRTRREAAGEGARYTITQSRPVNDLVVAGSRRLATHVVESESGDIRLSHVDLTPAQLRSISASAVDAMQRFARWFGPSELERLEFLFAPRDQGGGYARPGLVVMQVEDDADFDDPAFLRYLAHEVAHLWWAGAPTDSWQDWLNESFAEYAALMLLRDRLGTAEMDRRIRKYREAADSTPPIRGLDRGHEDAFAVLYRKGPVLLHELEQRIGTATFLDFLATLRAGQARTTAHMLEILARTASPADAAWLEASLDRPGV